MIRHSDVGRGTKRGVIQGEVDREVGENEVAVSGSAGPVGGETVTGGFVTVEADTAAAIGSGVVLSAAIKIARQGLTDAKPQSDAGLLHRVTRHVPIPCFVP